MEQELLMRIGEYLFITILQLLGIYFHVMQKISEIDDIYPEKGKEEIKRIFYNSEWDSLRISAAGVLLHLVIHFIADIYAPAIRENYPSYPLWMFGVALVMGYGGQKFIYKYLGKTSNFIDKNLGDKLN